jgi:superfamily I DNA and/or RNA helicase
LIIDTVERLQGAERDVILFSLTTSDPDHLESPFLNNPNRFNVAITRARHKLVVVGSRVFFTRVPRTEAGLLAHRCFTAYYHLCRERQALFEFDILGQQRILSCEEVVHER